MQVHHAVDAFVVFLQPDPVLERAEPMADMEPPRGAHPGEDPRAGTGRGVSQGGDRARIGPVEVENAIRTRRTIKAFEAEPVDRATLEQLLELARWAPNHHLTNPWRFRVVGPRALEALKAAAAELARATAP